VSVIDKWEADPSRGAEFVEPRRDEILAAAKVAADIAFLQIDIKKGVEIEACLARAEKRKSAIIKQVAHIEKAPAVEVVRKYWSSLKSEFWGQFLYNFVKDDG
jgi:hypothetical protein